MNNNNDQKFIAQEIRARYMEKEFTDLDALRTLDNKVKRPASVVAYAFGTISALIMGAGMSLTMTDIGTVIGLANSMMPGIVIGLTGMLMAIANYPLYQKILASRKKKYAGEILSLSEKLLVN